MTPKARIWRTLEDMWLWELPRWAEPLVAAAIPSIFVLVLLWMAG